MATQACPTKQQQNSKEWKLLVEETNEKTAMRIWQENGKRLPPMEEIPAFIEKFQTKEAHLKNLNKAETVEDIINKLDNPDVEKLSDQRGYRNKKTKEIINKRVSDLVKEYARHYGINYKGEPDPFYGQKGTVVHRYLEEIGKAINEGENFTLKDIQQEVFKLKELNEFEGMKDSFFRISPKQFKNLKKGMTDFINSIKKIQKKEVDADGDVEFRFEIPVMDEARDVAGTIDMIAVFSDGSSAIYDFKTFSRQGKQPPGQQAIERWNIQMINYKNILKDNYGISKFRQSRIIPLQTQYGQYDPINETYTAKIADGFQKLSMQNEEQADAMDHLDPIPVEELTGDENLDRLVRKLIKEKSVTEEQYNRAKGKEKSRLLNKLSRINQSLQSIQLDRDITNTINDVKRLYKRYESRLRLSPTHKDYMTHKELYEAWGEVQLYNNLIGNYRNQLQDMSEEKSKKIRTELSRVEAVRQDLEEQVQEEVIDRLGKEVLKEGENPGFWRKNFMGLEDQNIPVFQKLNQLIMVAEENTRRETREEFEKIKEVDKKFSKWAKANGYSGMKKFDLLYDESTGNLVKKYRKELFDRKNEIVNKAKKDKNLTSKEKQWLKDHFEFDRERYNEKKDLIFENIDYEVSLNNITEEDAKERKERFINSLDVKASPSNFFSSGFLKAKEEGNEQYITEDWKFIQENEPVKEYYNMYLDYNEKWTEEFGYDTFSKYFIANVKQSLVTQAAENGVTGLGNALDTIKRQHQIYQEDEMSGVTNDQGQSLAQIPLPYTDPVRVPLSDSKEEQIRNEVEADVEILHERGTQEFQQEVDRRIRQEEFRRGKQQKSKDLTRSLMAMVYSVNNYRNKLNIEGEALLLKGLVQNDMIEQKEINDQSETVIRKFTNDTLTKVGLDPELKDMFDGFFDMLIYGQEFEKDRMIGEYSANKLFKSFKNYMSVRSLGLNLTIQAADYIQGKSSLWMMAKEGRYFGTEDYKNSISQLAGRDEEAKNVIEFFEPDTRDLRSENIELAGANVLSRRATQRTMFAGYEWADENIANTILTAVSNRWVVDSDGKIKNPESITTEILDEDAPTVQEAIQKTEDGDLYIEGLSRTEFANFRAKIHHLSNRIRGTITERQRGLVSRSILGQAVTQFRSWIPGLATERYQPLQEDATMEDLEVGRFNVAMGEIIGNGFLKSVDNFTRLGTEIVSMGLYKKNINRQRVQEELAEFLKRNPEYKGKLTEEKFIKMKRDKMNGFVAEMRVFLSFFVLTQLLANLEWDEEDEAAFFSFQAQQIAQRALLEATFWYNPSSVDQIITSPLPLMTSVNEFKQIAENSIVEASYAAKGERNPRDKTPFGYYMFKATPGVNQVLDLMNYFERYNAPKSLFEKIYTDPDGDDE